MRSASEEAARFGVRFVKQRLTRENFRRTLDPLLGRGDFLLNVSVDVSSIALIRYCWDKGAMYLDTCIEPWPGGYTDPTIPAAKRTNYALREEALALRTGNARAPTAVLTHGANPGLVSHLVKQALLNIAADVGRRRRRARESRRVGRARAAPRREGDPHRRARHPGVDASRRSRTSSSTPGRWTASSRKARSRPSSAGARTSATSRATAAATISAAAAAIYLAQPGVATRVRSWTPLNGPYHGFLITHAEAISIADYFTVRKDSQVLYGPTVHYCLSPVRCRGAVGA